MLTNSLRRATSEVSLALVGVTLPGLIQRIKSFLEDCNSFLYFKMKIFVAPIIEDSYSYDATGLLLYTVRQNITPPAA
jgi:hypothetical protein